MYRTCRHSRLILSLIVSLFFAGQAMAHAALESSTPANHAKVAVAPTTIELHFVHPVKLTLLKLTGDSQDIPVSIDLSAPSAKIFSIKVPLLKPSFYQVKWSALSGDGHAATGNFDFDITGN